MPVIIIIINECENVNVFSLISCYQHNKRNKLKRLQVGRDMLKGSRYIIGNDGQTSSTSRLTRLGPRHV